MRLYRLLKNKFETFPTLNHSLILLLILAQLALWYPFLTNAQDKLAHNQSRVLRSLESLEELNKQSMQLVTPDFLQEPWATHRVITTKGAYPTQFWLEGTASISHWQILLESLEESIGLSLFSVTWKKEAGGLWFGRLQFDLIKPLENRVYHNWLPIIKPLNHLAPQHWTLVSTMQVNGKTSALISYKNTQHWIYTGSWLPDVGISVENVAPDKVVLMTTGGEKLLLKMLNVGDGR